MQTLAETPDEVEARRAEQSLLLVCKDWLVEDALVVRAGAWVLDVPAVARLVVLDVLSKHS